MRYRRSPAIVLYWSGTTLTCFNARNQTRLSIVGALALCLDQLSGWTTPAQLADRSPHLGSVGDVTALLESLSTSGLVDRTTTTPWSWQSWSPEAAFFHFGTRDAEYPSDRRRHEASLTRKARTEPPPPATKVVRGRRTKLPAPHLDDAISRTLKRRRTWRNFSRGAVTLAELSNLLHLTWGVQRWGVVKGQGRVPLKTSPSGGARHSIEAYVLAVNVAGLPAGAYHYDSAKHELVDLKHAIDGGVLTSLLAGQDYFGRSAFAIVMTAVFARAMWRYPYNRAYRSLLVEAGHLGQTFCLLATHMNLAPYCTMAFSEQQVERILDVDAERESALYVVGAGGRSEAHASLPGRTRLGART